MTALENNIPTKPIEEFMNFLSKTSSKKLAIILMATSMLSLGVPAANSAEISTKEFNQRVEDYILNNPDVIAISLQRAEQLAELQEVKRKKMIIADNKKTIYDDENTAYIGAKNASATVVEYFDYNCGACKVMFRALEVLLLQDKDVKVIFKEFPIFGEESENLAKIGHAIHKLYGNEKYYQYHAKMMKFQGKMTSSMALTIAGNMDFNVADIQKAAAKPEFTVLIDKDREIATQLGARGTPTLIIGGEIIPHALDVGGLKQKIAKVRAAKK